MSSSHLFLGLPIALLVLAGWATQTLREERTWNQRVRIIKKSMVFCRQSMKRERKHFSEYDSYLPELWSTRLSESIQRKDRR